MASHSFRCYAYRQAEKRYVAYCLDLMLAGEVPTLEAAIADLDGAILAHVEAAYKRGWEDELIPRPARLGRWLEFYWLLLSYPLRVLLGGFDNSLFVFRKSVQVGEGEAVVYA